jgi:drug/metabolite transporter (DMT)-like permease
MVAASAAGAKNSYPGGAWPFMALLAGNAALALGPWLVRLTDTGPIAAGFWRLFLPLPVIAALAWRELTRTQAAPAIPPRIVWLLLAAGAFFALDLASWHVGIEQTKLGNATLFGNSGSLILMAWGLIALRRRPNRAETIALCAALGGGTILLARSLEISPATLVGDLLCVLAGAFYVLYLLPAQAARRSTGQWSVLALVCASGAPVLLGLALLLGEPVWPGAAGWGPVVALAVLSQLVGQGLLVYALAYFPPLVIGMALLTQPAIAALSGWLAFGEVLGWQDIAGMAMVAAALVIARGRAPASPG